MGVTRLDARKYLEAYYASYDEEGRLSSQHGRVEYLTTMRYIDRYLEPGMRVMEIGAGTGRYTLALAEMGYQVDAVELVESNLEIHREKTQPGMRVRARQGNALDLSEYPDDTYDMTLLFGPMYHLFTREEQLRALSEALRVTKPGGVLLCAYCIADASILRYGFMGGHIWDLIGKGLLDTDTFRARSTPEELFQLYRKEDIDALDGNFAVERLHYVATDLATNYMRGCVDAMDDEVFHMYVKYHFAICERPDMVGATHHSLDVLRKLP